MAAIKVNIHEAKTHLSRLLMQVEAGEEVIVARSGKPVARIVQIEASVPVRILGRDAGLFEVPEDFDAPLPEDVLEEFEARAWRATAS